MEYYNGMRCFHRLLILIPLLLAVLPLAAEDIPFHTVYRDDKVYESRGTVRIEEGNRKVLNSILIDTRSYNSWALKGLDGSGEGAEALPAFLVDLIPDKKDSSKFTIIYNLNRFMKFRGLKAPFQTEVCLDSSGDVDSLSFIYIGGTAFLKEARYSFIVKEGEGSLINLEFVCEARLAGILDIFFTVPSYDYNMGFYIEGISGNLLKRLEQSS